MTQPARNLAIYVHWPFCLARCPYCDFNAHVRETVPEDRWRAALLAELEYAAARTGGRCVTSIFFGGGTPSLMQPETVAAVIEAIGRHWMPTPDAEITLEANPGAVEAERFRGFSAAGVNRLSLGIQSFDDEELRFLGRIHGAAEAHRALDLAQDNFGAVSFDLIYALPDQTPDEWRRALEGALVRAGDHLSVYQLTIEPGTPFATAAAQGRLSIPNEDLADDLYDTTQDVLGNAGLPAYEISNHARDGAQSRHNLAYWRYGDYLGVGPGAHGRLTLEGEKRATRCVNSPEKWLAAVERAGHGAQEEIGLSSRERGEEMLMMGLRLAEGVETARFHAETGEPVDAFVGADRIGRLTELGMLAIDDRRLRATDDGRRRLDAVLATLLA